MDNYFSFDRLSYYKDNNNEVFIILAKPLDMFNPSFELHWNSSNPYSTERVYYYNSRSKADYDFAKIINYLTSH